jgi:hypothetical protein
MAEPVQRPLVSLFEEEAEQALGGQPLDQDGDLPVRTRLPQHAQQPGHAIGIGPERLWNWQPVGTASLGAS